MDWLSQVIAELASARAKAFAMTRLVSHSASPHSQNGCSQFFDDRLHSPLNRQLVAAFSRCIMMCYRGSP